MRTDPSGDKPMEASPEPTCAKILDGVAQTYVGDRALLRKLLSGALANGHVLFEDHPGLGKTLLDRFLLRLSMGYPPTPEAETEILRRRLSWKSDDPTRDMKPIVDLQGFTQMQRAVEEKVFVHPAILQYISRIVRGVREHASV